MIVVPSMGEGFGMVALEAMERARPVIAASIGGLGELVADGETGLLVAPGEAEPLARGDLACRRATSSGGEDGRGRSSACAHGVSRGALHRSGRTHSTAMRWRPLLVQSGLLVDFERSRRHPLDGEHLRGAGAPELAVGLPEPPPRRGYARLGELRCVVGRKEETGDPVQRRARCRARIDRDDGLSRPTSPRASRARNLPSGRDGRATSRTAVELGHVPHAPRHEHAFGDAELTPERLERCALGAIAEHERASRRESSGSARIATSTPFCGVSRATQRRSGAPSSIASGGLGLHGSGSASRP